MPSWASPTTRWVVARFFPSVLLALLLQGCPNPELGDTPQTLSTRSDAQALSQLAADRWPAEELSFDWQQTVLSYGMHRLHTASGDAEPQGYYRTWLDTALEERWDDPLDPPEFLSSDGLSPSILAVASMAEDPGADYQPILDSADAYLVTVPHTPQGALVHWGPDHILGGNPEVWIDSMFMVGVYRLQRYSQTGDEAFLEAWAEQYLAFAYHCRDAGSGLWWHAWDEGDGENIPEDPTFWARGNSWVLVSAAEAARLAGGDHPALAEVMPLARDHAGALMELQNDDGSWNTVLASPDMDHRNYAETSSTALIGYGLHNLGIGLDEHIWDRSVVAAAGAIQARLVEGPDGLELVGTSLPTNPGDYDYYVGIGQLTNQMTGIGASIMFLSEADGFQYWPE